MPFVSIPASPTNTTDSSSSRIFVRQDALDIALKATKTSSSSTSLRRSISVLNKASTDTQRTEDTSSCGSSSTSQNQRNLQWNWREGILQKHTDSHVIVFVDENTVKLPGTALTDGSVVLANEYTADRPPPDDLITLTHLHEPAVVETLQQRYQSDTIYTSTGPVLLALNPFQSLRNLYAPSVQHRYAADASSQPPHVYGTADAAYRSMLRALEDGTACPHQSILVSGESGSGKTVTTKFVMQYLAAVSHQHGQPVPRAHQQHRTSNTSTPELGSIESHVLQSNPILEAFGNARTVRNDNSSRFGKFIEIQFASSKGVLVGAHLETYLLEKVRLVRPGPGERNYHILYQLLQAPRAQKQKWRLLQLEHYKLLGTCHTRRDGVPDQLDPLVAAVHDSLLPAVAGILHAGNITFTTSDNDHDTSQLETTSRSVVDTCALWGVTPHHLQTALCQSTLTVQGTRVHTSKTTAQAATGLEALLKETYGAIFHYVVDHINAHMQAAAASGGGTIGVLDIFGFESFTINSFEQLCINYCNEALQQQFNAFVLQKEQEEYEQQGIQWSFIEFPENTHVLQLLEDPRVGLLSLLDDQCRAPGPSDKAYALAVYRQHATNSTGMNRFLASRQQQARLQFAVHHYAGPVEYSIATGFTAKNKDELPKETVELLESSTVPLLQTLAERMRRAATAATTDTPQKKKTTTSRPTVGGQFRRQLKTLRAKIDATSPHYIRCLKPNDLLVPDHFDTAMVAEQLKCGGILEAVRVARAGFAQRYTHADFLKRYRSLAWKELQRVTMNKSSTVASSSYRRSYPAYIPKQQQQKPPKKSLCDLTVTERKHQCKDLIRILYKKIRQQGVQPETPKGQTPVTPVAKAKTYSFHSPPPSWLAQSKVPVASPPSPRTAASASPAATDYIKLGIQMGNTKVFLRPKAFDALERMRSREQTRAAVLLNAQFRRYLARIAYLPYRSAYRRARDSAEDIKESKEDDHDEAVNKSFQSLRSFHSTNSSGAAWDHWTVIREAIHNPRPRHEWGRQDDVAVNKFKWVIVDGLWVKNFGTTRE